MGKDNGNTTNSWLNLGKILELCINGGVSTITGKNSEKQMQKTDVAVSWRCFKISVRFSTGMWRIMWTR